MKRLSLFYGALALLITLCTYAITQEAGHAPNRIYTSQAGHFYLNGASFYNSDTTPSDISTQLNVLDSLSAAEFAFLDGVTAGTVTASKAAVVDASKDIGDFRNLDCTNLDAGASGTAGTVDVFPTTASKGKLALTCTDQTGDTAVTINAEAMGQATNVGIPDPGGADCDVVLNLGNQTIAGTKTFSADIQTSSGVGAKNGTGVAATEKGDGIIHKTVLTCTAVDVALTDEAGVVAYGSLKVYDMPEGAVRVLGCTSDIDLTKSSAGVNVDWDGDVGLGTTAADNDATLATTEQDLIPTTATPQAAAGATTANAQSTSTEDEVFDGTGTAKDVYINLLVDDADHDVNGTPCNLILNGTITIVWANLGDY